MNGTVPNSTPFWARISHASFAIRCRCVETVGGSESSPSFPSAVPSHGIPFPPQGLLEEEFPCFNGTMECSDSPSSVPPHFVFLRLAVPSTHERFAPRDGPCRIEGPGAFALRVAIPQATSLGWKRLGLPRSWRTRCADALFFDPGRIVRTRPFRCDDAAPARTKTKAPTKPISGLNHTAWALAVYASQDRSLHHHARLASGCRPGSTGRDWLPAGFQ